MSEGKSNTADAHLAFLKECWGYILDDRKSEVWFQKVARLGDAPSDTTASILSRTVDKLLNSGASKEDLALLVQHVQYQMLVSVCSVISSEGYETSVNWVLNEVNDKGAVIGEINALHEFADGVDANGLEEGYR